MEETFPASPSRSTTPALENDVGLGNGSPSRGNGGSARPHGQGTDIAPHKTDYRSPTVETDSEDSLLQPVPADNVEERINFHGPEIENRSERIPRPAQEDNSPPTISNYHSPTVETASEGSSLYPAPVENFTIGEIGVSDISANQHVMSGALNGNPIFLPDLPLDDHVRDSNRNMQASSSNPHQHVRMASHRPHPRPIPSRFWFRRAASDYEAFSSSPFTSRARRQHQDRAQVLSSSPLYLPYDHRRMFKVLELRSNIHGTIHDAPGYTFHWQLCRYYVRQALLPVITEQDESQETADERRQPQVIPNYLFSQILDEQGVLPFSNFEHLQQGNFKSETRHMKGCMTCVDYVAGTTVPRFNSTFWGLDEGHAQWDLHSTTKEEFLGDMWNPIPKSVVTRLLIVEDLSEEVIRFLGTRFHVSPEFFEEHLINSGYRDGQYDDLPSHSWKTYSIKKDYVSIKWYRPVIRQEETPPISTRSEEDLLRSGFLSYVETGDVFRTETNIFRPKWDLETDPQTSPEGQRPCGWEERASVWTREMENCNLVILILDPLPTLARGLIQRNAISTRFLSLVDEEQAPEKLEKLHRNETGQHRISKRAHLKSRPPPKIPTRFEKLLLRLLRWLQRLRRKEWPEVSISSSTGLLVRNFRKLNSVQVFQQTTPRVDVSSEYRTAFSSAEQLQAFNEKVFVTRSTVTDFLDWLNAPVFWNTYQLAPLGVVAPILQVVVADTLSFCRLIHNGLNQISEDIIDEEKLEEGLFIWRHFIGRCQRELPELQSSIIRFQEALYPNSKAISYESHDGVSKIDGLENDTRRLDLQFQDLINQITRLREEVAKAANSLTSNMSLLDSKRSIQEARSVTKLTELAFIFIPLTFSASIFGMQVDSFTNRAPLWVFIVLALCVTIVSYTVRLIIRSQTMTYAKSRAIESMASYAKELKVPYRRGQPVPTGLVVSWALYKVQLFPGYLISLLGSGILRLWTLVGFWIASALMISLVAAAPLAVLRTRHNVNAGLKNGLSVMITIISAAIILIPFWRSSSPQFRAALPRLIYRILRAIVGSDIFQAALRGGLGLAAAATPLIVLWTRDLAIGIKAAVTALLVLGLVSMVIAFLIWRLVSIARTSFLDSDSDDDDSSMVD